MPQRPSLAELNLTNIGNWAEAVEQEGKVKVPEGKGTQADDIETVTEIIEDKDGVRKRVITTYKKITKKVPRPIAERKKWAKFGASANDGPGPNVMTTYVADEVRMTFFGGRIDQQKQHDTIENKKPEKSGGSRIHCRICKSDDHWSIHCPFKEMLLPNDSESAEHVAGGRPSAPSTSNPGRYVPPSLRGIPSSSIAGGMREEYTCRVTNLPEDSATLDDDLRGMFSRVGRIERFYLARDRGSGRLKGFAFVTYSTRADAEEAIQRFNGYRMHHLILKVEWTAAKPRV